MPYHDAVSAMVRIQLVRYRKRYLTKAVYNCKRYFYVPVRLAETLDLSIDYEVDFRDPYVILIPKNIENINEFQKKLEEHKDGRRLNH